MTAPIPRAGRQTSEPRAHMNPSHASPTPPPQRPRVVYRQPPETMAECEAALGHLETTITKIDGALTTTTPADKGGDEEYASWQRRARDAIEAHREQHRIFRYYREVLRVPASDPTAHTRHLDTRYMRDPLTVAEAEVAVEVLQEGIAGAERVIANVAERGDTSEPARIAVDRASVARRHYSERLPVMRYHLETLRSDAAGPGAMLDALSRALPSSERDRNDVRRALAVLREAAVRARRDPEGV